MNDDRKMLNELFARCDRHDAETEAWEARRAQQLLKKRAAVPGQLVYKTTYAEPRPRAVMDEQTQKAWNDWCDGRADRRVQRAIGEFSDAFADIVGEFVAGETKKLREEISALRAELTIERAHSAKADQLKDSEIARHNGGAIN